MKVSDCLKEERCDGPSSTASAASLQVAAYHMLYLVMGFLFGSIFWIFYPGRTCTDSASHIEQAAKHVFSAHHARLTSYLLSWLPNFELLPNYSWFFLLNIVATLAFIPFFVRLSLSPRIPALLGFGLTASISFVTAIILAPLTITIWKDALMNSLLIIMGIITAVILIDPHLKRRSKVCAAIFGSLLACAVINVRPNGYLATIPFMAVYFLQGFPRVKNSLLRYCLLAFWTIALPFISVFAARVVMPAEPANQEEHIMNSDLLGMKTLGANLLADTSASAELAELAQGMMNLTWQGEIGNCWDYPMPQRLKHMKQLWFSTILRNPLLYIRVRTLCFKGLLPLPRNRAPIAYVRSAFVSSPYIKEFIPVSPIREQALNFFDSLYSKFAYGSAVLSANVFLLFSSSVLFFFFRDRVIGTSAVISLSASILFAGYFFIITIGDFRFITWVLSSVALSTILTFGFFSRCLSKLISRERG